MRRRATILDVLREAQSAAAPRPQQVQDIKRGAPREPAADAVADAVDAVDAPAPARRRGRRGSPGRGRALDKVGAWVARPVPMRRAGLLVLIGFGLACTWGAFLLGSYRGRNAALRAAPDDRRVAEHSASAHDGESSGNGGATSDRPEEMRPQVPAQTATAEVPSSTGSQAGARGNAARDPRAPTGLRIATYAVKEENRTLIQALCRHMTLHLASAGLKPEWLQASGMWTVGVPFPAGSSASDSTYQDRVRASIRRIPAPDPKQVKIDFAALELPLFYGVIRDAAGG